MMPQYPRYKGFPRPTVDCSDDEPITVQASRDEVDINRIVSRIEKGLAVPMLGDSPFYGDVSMLDGLQDALIQVREANDLFMAYPANVRERFDNDPVRFVDFMSDNRNFDEAVKLGLVPAKPEEAKPKAAPAAEGGSAQ